jgi:hypothetical protein
MLFKSLPATQGMQRNRLFHIIDPNAGHTCTIATFQKSDKAHIEQWKLSLEQEIRSVLEKGEAPKVFIDEIEGIWFGGTVRHKNGKPFSITAPSKTDMEFRKHTDAILNKPPNKKRFQQNSPTPANTNPATPGAHISLTHHISPPPASTNMNTQSPTPMTHQITAAIENRFHIVETELTFQRETQKDMDNRLHQLEHRTTTIDDNINQMMAHWKITPAQKCKATSDLPDNETHYTEHMDTDGNALTPSDHDTNKDATQC